ILAFLWQLALHAQSNSTLYIDSLLQILQTNRHDTIQVNALNELATHLMKDNPDSSIALSAAALSLSQKINNKPGEAHSYISLGQAYVVKSNNEKAQTNFEQALRIYELIRNYHGIAEAN